MAGQAKGTLPGKELGKAGRDVMVEESRHKALA